MSHFFLLKHSKKLCLRMRIFSICTLICVLSALYANRDIENICEVFITDWSITYLIHRFLIDRLCLLKFISMKRTKEKDKLFVIDFSYNEPNEKIVRIYSIHHIEKKKKFFIIFHQIFFIILTNPLSVLYSYVHLFTKNTKKRL